MSDTTNDRDVLDAIATLLGTSPAWSSAADFLEDIANLVGRARPHPGGHDCGADYREVFQAATGRDLDPEWDQTGEDET